MEQLVASLRELIDFKETTEVGDLVLIAAKDPQMLVYASVRAIDRDESRKEEWWQVQLDMLSVPIQSVIWTLREPQFTGKEVFTMGGKGRFVQAVRLSKRAPDPAPKPDIQPSQAPSKGGLRLVK
jgi:hypothetical protein